MTREEPREIDREPFRGGQICGEQTEYGVVMGRVRFCAERKAARKYFCTTHDKEARANGVMFMAPGNAKGDPALPVVLSWEPMDDNPAPVEPTTEELEAYEELMRR